VPKQHNEDRETHYEGEYVGDYETELGHGMNPRLSVDEHQRQQVRNQEEEPTTYLRPSASMAWGYPRKEKKNPPMTRYALQTGSPRGRIDDRAKTYMKRTKCRSLCRPTHWFTPSRAKSWMLDRARRILTLGEQGSLIQYSKEEIRTDRTVMVIF
jgi:hypothetical protein